MSACAPSPPPPPRAEDIVAKAIARTEKLQTVHFSLEVTKGFVLMGPGLRVLRAEGDVARPDRLRVRARVEVFGLIVETEMVQVAGAAYFLDPITARWVRLGGGLGVVPLLDPDQGVVRLMRAGRDLRIDGSETVDGVSSSRIRGRIAASDVTALLGGTATTGDANVEALIGDDGLVRRLVLSGAIASGESDETVRRLEFSRFDVPVTIEPPP